MGTVNKHLAAENS